MVCVLSKRRLRIFEYYSKVRRCRFCNARLFRSFRQIHYDLAFGMGVAFVKRRPIQVQ